MVLVSNDRYDFTENNFHAVKGYLDSLMWNQDDVNINRLTYSWVNIGDNVHKRKTSVHVGYGSVAGEVPSQRENPIYE